MVVLKKRINLFLALQFIIVVQTVIALAYLVPHFQERNKVSGQLVFEKFVAQKEGQLKSILETTKNLVASTSAFYKASKAVEPQEFELFISSTMGSGGLIDEDVVNAVGWKWEAARANVTDPSLTLGRKAATVELTDARAEGVGDAGLNGSKITQDVPIAYLRRPPSNNPSTAPYFEVAKAVYWKNSQALRGVLTAQIDIKTLLQGIIYQAPEGLSLIAHFVDEKGVANRWQLGDAIEVQDPKTPNSRGAVQNHEFSTTHVDLAAGKFEIDWLRDQPIHHFWPRFSDWLYIAAVIIAAAIIIGFVRHLDRTGQDLKMQRDKAREADLAKSAFLATMSHEIRTPLNGIIGMADLVRKTKLDIKQRNFLDELIWSADGLLAIINDILDFSKLEAGQHKADNVVCDFQQIVRHTVATFQIPAREKNIKLIMDLEDRLPVHIVSDPMCIRQVITNLVSNAIKFTAKGYVKLSVRQLPRGDSRKRRWLEIVVSDTGIGISQNDQRKIFDRFHQGDNTAKRNFGGTGLGLAIVKQLVGLLGGEIRLESTTGEGTSVSVLIPLEVPSNRAVSKAFPVVDQNEKTQQCLNSTAYGPSHGLRVLVAEDDRINRIYIGELLQDLGHFPVFAANGFEAIEKVQSGEHDLVLMDCQMPVCDGYEATQKIRGLPMGPKLAQIPVVALTANAIVGDRERCIAAGMDDYLSKPVRRESLLRTISRSMKTMAAQTLDDDADIEASNVAAATPNQDSEAFGLSTNSAAVESKEGRVSSFSSSDTSNTFDLDSLNSLKKTMGKKFASMVDCYLEDLSDYSQQLENAMKEQNSEEVRRLAHSIKSSSKLFGAISISTVAKDLEHRAIGATEKWSLSPIDLQPLNSEIANGTDKLRKLISMSTRETSEVT
ncbi:MAG: response regulator [Alphaproteobacteria bacterium]|nr:response regulator [Alphaproteobacteria bacterium]